MNKLHAQSMIKMDKIAKTNHLISNTNQDQVIV